MRKSDIGKSIIVIAGISLLACAAGYTYSYFSDREESTATFSGGTLDLNLSKEGAGSQAVFNAQNILPGQEVEGEIDLDNSGTIPITGIMLSADSGIQ